MQPAPFVERNLSEDALIARAKTFLDRIVGLSIREHIRAPMREIRSAEKWPWAGETGIYYFVHQGEVVYVGRGLCIGNRIGTHLEAKYTPEWEAIMNDEETIVGVWPFDRSDWPWVAGLEVALIEPPNRPKFNGRS